MSFSKEQIIAANVAILNQPSVHLDIRFMDDGSLSSISFDAPQELFEVFIHLGLNAKNERYENSPYVIRSDFEQLVRLGIKPEILDGLFPEIAMERQQASGKSFVAATTR